MTGNEEETGGGELWERNNENIIKGASFRPYIRDTCTTGLTPGSIPFVFDQAFVLVSIHIMQI